MKVIIKKGDAGAVSSSSFFCPIFVEKKRD